MGLTAPTIIRRLSSLCVQQRGFEQQGLNGLQGRLIDHVTAHPVHIGMQPSSQISWEACRYVRREKQK